LNTLQGATYCKMISISLLPPRGRKEVVVTGPYTHYTNISISNILTHYMHTHILHSAINTEKQSMFVRFNKSLGSYNGH